MEYTPGVIYRNIFKFLEYRKYNFTPAIMSDEKLAETLNSIEYVILNASKIYDNKTDFAKVNNLTSAKNTKNNFQYGEKIVVLMIAPGSKYAMKSPDLKKLLTDLTGKTKEQSRYIIITKEDVKSSILRILDDFKSDMFKYEHHTYNMFITIIPEHELVPKHEFATKEEVEEQIDVYYRQIASFPKISVRDPPIVWLGANVGDVIKITRNSENSLSAVVYRVVVR